MVSLYHSFIFGFAQNNPPINPSLLDHILLNNTSQFVSGVSDLDTVNHCPTIVKFKITNILCSKTLHKFQLRPISQSMPKFWARVTFLKLFKSYLLNRKQCVRMGSSSSSITTSNIRVPQCGIFGPIIFILFINDLPNVTNVSKPLLFVDDTFLFSNSNNDVFVGSVNSELEIINTWCVENRLTVNSGKNVVFKQEKFRDQCVKFLTLN